jgi:PAS domain S-box-containing protein
MTRRPASRSGSSGTTRTLLIAKWQNPLWLNATRSWSWRQNQHRVGCYTSNLETGVITVSEGYAVIHGLPDGTIQTTLSQWRTRVHPEDLAQFDKLRTQLFGNRRRNYAFDYRVILADGGVRWIESRGLVSYDKDGQPRDVVGINIDVTERKQTEARLSDALAAGQVVAFEWNAVTGRSQRSENAADILGSDNGPVASSQGSVFLKHIHPDDRASLKTRIRELRASDPSYAQNFRYVRPDGRQVWLEEVAKGEFDEAGKLLRIKGLTRDVTERKCAEERQHALAPQ